MAYNSRIFFNRWLSFDMRHALVTAEMAGMPSTYGRHFTVAVRRCKISSRHMHGRTYEVRVYAHRTSMDVTGNTARAAL
jgi:hypothetical protein